MISTCGTSANRSSQTSNNRFERSRAASSSSEEATSMIGIKCLRLTQLKPRVAQLHR